MVGGLDSCHARHPALRPITAAWSEFPPAADLRAAGTPLTLLRRPTNTVA